MNDSVYTIMGKCTLKKTDNEISVLKKKNSDNIKGLFTYLSSRDFFYFPAIIENNKDDLYSFEYIEDTSMPKEQRAEDLIYIISLLHHKTSYFKEVKEDKFKEIYESIESNIVYYKNYYNNLFNTFFKERYQSPSHYLFMRNYYKLSSALLFCSSELEKWYDLVKYEKKQRISVVHNNLSIDHLLKGEKEVIISWDNHKFDTPVLDLVNFYKNDHLKYDFSSVLEKYFERYPYSDAEKKLFFILISIPPKIEFKSTEFKNTIMVRETLDYIFKTENLTRPYYSTEEYE